MKKIIQLSVVDEDGKISVFNGVGYFVVTDTYIPGETPGIHNGTPLTTVAAHIVPRKEAIARDSANTDQSAPTV